MGGQKQTSEAEYKFFQKPGWEELNALKAWNPQDDPSINFEEGNQINDLERSFVAPTGSYMTPELREQMMRSGRERIGQQAALNRRADKYGQNQLKLGQLGQAAQLGAPEFGKTKETQKSGGGFWGNLLGAGLSAASAFI